MNNNGLGPKNNVSPKPDIFTTQITLIYDVNCKRARRHKYEKQNPKAYLNMFPPQEKPPHFRINDNIIVIAFQMGALHQKFQVSSGPSTILFLELMSLNVNRSVDG